MYAIFGTSTCKWCDEAKNLLTRLGLPFTFRNIEEPDNLLDYQIEFVGKKTVPQIMLYGYAADTYIGGYEDLVKHLNA